MLASFNVTVFFEHTCCCQYIFAYGQLRTDTGTQRLAVAMHSTRTSAKTTIVLSVVLELGLLRLVSYRHLMLLPVGWWWCLCVCLWFGMC